MLPFKNGHSPRGSFRGMRGGGKKHTGNIFHKPGFGSAFVLKWMCVFGGSSPERSQMERRDVCQRRKSRNVFLFNDYLSFSRRWNHAGGETIGHYREKSCYV